MDTLKKKSSIFVIVDGFSTGRLLTRYILQNKGKCFHVQSSTNLPSYYLRTFEQNCYEKTFVYKKESEDDLIAVLKESCVDFILAGTETGVILADRLSEKLNLISNGTKLSEARRNKYLMIETLKKSGLKTVAQMKSNSYSEILSWVKENNYFPYVLKPINSAGADSVSICHNSCELEKAFNQKINQRNKLGIVNTELLLQNLLQGTEYIVNTVSRDRKHFVCDMWKCHKEKIQGAGYISCMEELIPFAGDVAEQLADYAFNVLNALEINHGPAHHEIMYTSEGPILIEVGARLQGAINPDSITTATGYNQLSLSYEAYADPGKFLSYVGKKYQLKNFMYHSFMISRVHGILKELPRLEEIKNMKSFYNYIPWVHYGQEIVPTIDLFKSAGVIDFIHQNKSILDADYTTFRKLEEMNFYVV